MQSVIYFVAKVKKSENVKKSPENDWAIKRKKSQSQKQAECYKAKGNEFYQQGKYELAIEQYTKAIEVNQNFAIAYFNRGLCFKKLGRFDKFGFFLTENNGMCKNIGIYCQKTR